MKFKRATLSPKAVLSHTFSSFRKRPCSLRLSQESVWGKEDPGGPARPGLGAGVGGGGKGAHVNSQSAVTTQQSHEFCE